MTVSSARNLLFKETDYKGHSIYNCPSEDCPCRPCWRPNNFRYDAGAYQWRDYWDCATRYYRGCPDNPKPVHILKNLKKLQKAKDGDIYWCLRCGAKVVIGKDAYEVQTVKPK